MDTSKVMSLLEQLDDELDDLEDAISPLTQTALSEPASKLPLLDKAKLYVLVTYAIESMLFSYLRLHGVKAREHSVFTELTRVKQYFAKLKAAEDPANNAAGKRENLTLDKGAAQRIITAGLSGNDKYDLKQAEQQAKERARAHIKFTELSQKPKQEEILKKRKAEKTTEAEEENERSFDSDSISSDTNSESEQHMDTDAPDSTIRPKKRQKNKRNDQKKPVSGDLVPPSVVASSAQERKTRKGKEKKKRKSSAKPKVS